MRYFKIAFIFSLALLIFAGCSKEEIQPDPLNTADEAILKGAKAKKGKEQCKPFKASFDLIAYFDRFGPIYKIDEEDDWVFPPFPPTMTPGMHIIIEGNGNATHMGKTDFEIVQWWTRAHPGAPKPDVGYFSYGQGDLTFTAANGDRLFATYWGWADHQDDLDGTEILTFGTFTGGTGRYYGASGSYIWDGLFIREFMPVPNVTPYGEKIRMGTGEVIVTGSIKY